MTRYQSWARYPPANCEAVPMHWRHLALPIDTTGTASYLPFGNGRSYGDSCLNQAGYLIDARGLDRFIDFDPDNGVIRCEAGVLLSIILDKVIPSGWFLPVVPGTQLVTVGGAIANDVHGKNHHRAGTFGCHVRCFELLRSDGERLLCSPEENPEWYHASIGGLGLTGLITWAELTLKKISSPHLIQSHQKFSALDTFFELSESSDQVYEYTVAWIDCLAKSARGIFFRANHAEGITAAVKPRRSVSLPLLPPLSIINRASATLFNWLYYQKTRPSGETPICYQRFFFPLDAIRDWHRIYGPRGFLQYQCVVPLEGGKAAIDAIMQAARTGPVPSFLGVLKVFGAHSSGGMLSFPRPGITLALDFPNRDTALLDQLERFDAITGSAGGAVYPAKDARMSRESFKSFFSDWERFATFVDPSFSSDFWWRVSGG